MEQGTLSEFRGEADPESFSQAMEHLETSLAAIDVALQDYDRLLEILNTEPSLPEFEQALERRLTAAGPFERITLPDSSDNVIRAASGIQLSLNTQPDGSIEIIIRPQGRRSDDTTTFSDLYTLMSAQREDLQYFRDMVSTTVGYFKDVFPEVQEGNFVRTMLANQHPFADSFEDMVSARSTFSNFYTQSCMESVQAAMDIFPTGFEFVGRPE